MKAQMNNPNATPFEQGVAARRKDGDGVLPPERVSVNPYTHNYLAKFDWSRGYAAEDERIANESFA